MMKSLEKSFNKTSESYACVLSDCKEQGVKVQKRKIRNKKHNERRKIMRFHILRKITNSNKKHIKNLSNYTLTTAQINLLSRGLKFIPTPSIAENHIKQQLLQDFENFARRMRLQYIFQGQDNERHPFYVRSNWVPPVQPSVALETFLEEVKVELAEIQLSKPKHNLPISRFCALSTWHWIGCLHWVVTRLPLICFAKWRPLALVVGIMCVAVAVYSTKNRHVQNPWEMFQKVVRQHGLRGSSEVEKRMLASKAISSLRKGMCTIFTRVSWWRIFMSRHIGIDLSGKVQSLIF